MPIITTGLNSINISARVGVVVKEGVRSRSSASDVLPLQFTTQPQSQSVVSGNQVTFTCVVAGGYSPYSYQWKKDGVNIAGATSSSYTFTSVTGDNGKAYSVAVTDFSGNTIISDSAILSVSIPLSFTSQPQSKTVDEYSLATFSTSVTGGTAPYTYQWKKNGVNVGTNSANLSFTAAAADKNASITVVVTDSAGTVITSTPVVLGVTSYLFSYDGVTQGVTLASAVEIPTATPFVVSVHGTFKAGGFHIFSSDGNDRIGIDSVNSILIYNTNIYTIPTADANILYNGLKHTLTIGRYANNIIYYQIDGGVEKSTGVAYTPSIYLNRLFSKRAVGTSLPAYQGVAGNALISINGVVSLNNKLNNKSLGANQTSTVGPNATIVNYNAANWVAV